MLLALAGNQGNFLATVAVVDLAAKRVLNHLPIVRQQHHGRRNDPAWAKIPNVLVEYVAGQHEERMRMSEEDLRMLTLPSSNECRQALFVQVDGVEINKPVPQQGAHPPPQRSRNRGIAPQRSDLHAVVKPSPLV